MTPKLSIIIPNYNHASFLRQRLDSVYNQTYQDFEVILLDDASADTSTNLLEEYKSHPKTTQLIINKQNSGSPFKQWQKGIALAKGDYIWIAESDDYCELTFLEKTIKELNANSDVGLVYTRSNKVDSANNIAETFWADKLSKTRWKSDFKNNGVDEINNYLKFRNTIPNASACVFRKTVIGDWNVILGFKYTGDWVFWMNILSKSNVFFIAETVNHFRSHENTSREVKDKKSEIIRFIEYSKSIKIANKLTRSDSEMGNKNYHWIYQQLKYSKISFFDIINNYRGLKLFLKDYFRYLYFKR